MGFLDKIKSTVAKNADKADQVIDKAAEAVDKKTGGKHSDKIVKVVDKAKDAVDDLEQGKADGHGPAGKPSAR